MAWQEARDGGADDGVRAKNHLLFSVKSRSNQYARLLRVIGGCLRSIVIATQLPARTRMYSVAQTA
jgi:hypothetical protein